MHTYALPLTPFPFLLSSSPSPSHLSLPSLPLPLSLSLSFSVRLWPYLHVCPMCVSVSHTHTHTRARAPTFTLTLSHSRSLSLSRALSLSFFRARSLSRGLKHFPEPSRSLWSNWQGEIHIAHIRTHTHTYACTHIVLLSDLHVTSDFENCTSLTHSIYQNYQVHFGSEGAESATVGVNPQQVSSPRCMYII